MGVPRAYQSLAAENAQLAKYRQMNNQLRAYARDGRAVDRAQRLQARYAKSPWLSPGIATAYTKWEEQFGVRAARGLARNAYGASQAEGADKQSVNDSLEDFVAKKDFQRQVKAFRERDTDNQGIFGQILDNTPIIGAAKAAIEGKSWDEVALRAIPGAKSAMTVGQQATKIPAVGPAIKSAARVGFAALESPLQELQAAATGTLVGAPGALGSGKDPLGITGAIRDATDVKVGHYEAGTSTGALALRHLAAGDEVDLGSGYFPGGDIQREHTRAVREIASLRYKKGTHFATPGRLFAAAVTEPGTDPFNVLSGTVDALATIKADPANIVGGKLENIRKARKGFSASTTALDEAGAIRTWTRNATHGPTVDVFLDETRKGGRFLDDLSGNFMGRPEAMTELMRRTKWKYPAEVYASIASGPAGDRTAARTIMGEALGAEGSLQPKIRSFSASIANTTQQHKAFAEIPSVSNDLSALSGPNGSARSIYNHAIGIGLTDEQISTQLHGIISASGRVEHSVAIEHYMDMESTALENMGLPRDVAKSFSSFALNEMGKMKIYYDGQIIRGDAPPGVLVGGEVLPVDGPFLQSEFLGNRIWLPQITGKNGRNRAIGRYGRIMGIPETGFTNLEGVDGVRGLAESAYRGVRDKASGANAWGINAQNKIWKPVALLRGAWTLRVIGEEQVRMAMSGHNSLFSHPLRYMMQTFQHGKVGSEAEKDLLAWASDQGAMRGALQGTFGLPDPSTSAYGRLVQKTGDTAELGAEGYSRMWADRLINYHEDDLMQDLAVRLTSDTTDNALAAMKQEFLDGAHAGNRADLATAGNLQEAGYDLKDPLGADKYIDDLYERLHLYTGGDPDLINIVATGRYSPDLQAIARARSIKGRKIVLDDATGEVVAHKKGGRTAKVLFDDGTDQDVLVDQLTLQASDHPKILTRNADNIRVDEDFTGHLDSLDDSIKPAQVSGTVDKFENVNDPMLDRAVQAMFAFLMDKPTSYMSRSQTFLQDYLDEVERILPYMDSDAQGRILSQAGDILHQNDSHAIRGAFLHGRYGKLERAAKSATVDGLTFEEADDLAKGHALDSMRELLYDSHKKNRTLAALQLVMPFGEAFKEMVGSWGRIIAAKPITTARKLQITVNGARGANPFDYIPGGTQVPGGGFFFKDPSKQGAEMFAYPFSGAINEALFDVPVQNMAPVEGLSMGFQLMPGFGPAFVIPASYLMDRFMTDPKWDPIRQIVAPYGSREPAGLIESVSDGFFSGWMKKWMIAMNGTAGSSTHDAKVLNNLTIDVMYAGAEDGTYSLNSDEGIRKAFHDAAGKARWLYAFEGTFQFGAPASPSFDFIAKPESGKAMRFSIMRDEYFKMVKEDKKNGTRTATAKYITQFGERAMYAIGPKSIGSTLGQQFTETEYDWVRRNEDMVDKYPLVYAEFAPRAKDGDDDFSYDAYIRSMTNGERTALDPIEWAHRTNNILGNIWYDKLRSDLGVKKGDSGPPPVQAYLAEKRGEIAAVYPGWRELATDRSRIPQAVDQLIEAAYDPKLKRSNPTLIKSLREYVAARDAALDLAKEAGRIGDFQRPGYASANDMYPVREYLRKKARELGNINPQFYTLWQDTFEREMKED